MFCWAYGLSFPVSSEAPPVLEVRYRDLELPGATAVLPEPLCSPDLQV